MNRAWALMILEMAACLLLSTPTAWAADPSFDRRDDVIYGRKYGTALTMDVFTPKKDAKGIGVVFVVSGGFFSSHEAINPNFVRPLIDRGFTVFAVVHGSQPRFTVPEIIQDLNRAVRFIRRNAREFGIDPNRIGIYGGSAGGHLSLMLGTAGDKGDPGAKDPVDRESSRVQAVACFFPATDLLNFGKPGKEMIHATDHQAPFRAAFDYRELDKQSMLWVPITDAQRLREITRQISPITFVTPDDPPTLIIHGDVDKLVSLQQSELIVDQFKRNGVEAKLVVKKGAGHGWPGLDKDLVQFSDWFDQHLKKGSKESPSATRKMIPHVEGDWWQIAGNPDLGELTGEKQQPVDFTIWQAKDGIWQLWSCIRQTKSGGKTRLFYRWEGKALSDPNWTPRGIALRADPNVGETNGGLQAPHVIHHDGTFIMAYGDWQHIALATSDDGKQFRRRLNRSGTAGLFDEQPDSNTRDPMILPIGDRVYCYYTAFPGGKGAVYCRWSRGDLGDWGASRMVAFGGRAGTNPFSAECPHVVFLDGYYYMFRTQRYGQDAQTSVYRSQDPLNFGIEDDRCFVCTLPVAAPEIIQHSGEWFIATLNPNLDGIRIARLRWSPQE
jgi:acetyl esterase/lipase